MQLLKQWLGRMLNDPQILVLAFLLVAFGGVVIYAGDILAPLIASVVIAYLLEGIVNVFTRWGLPRLVAVISVFLGFMTTMMVIVFAIIPLLSREATLLVQHELPNFLAIAQRDVESTLGNLLARFPGWFAADYGSGVSDAVATAPVVGAPEQVRVHSAESVMLVKQQLEQITVMLKGLAKDLGTRALSFSLSSFVGLITFSVYAVITPLLVFFLLKDKQLILAWCTRFLPASRGLAAEVWDNVNGQLANYVRGKVAEMFLVWFVSYIVFLMLGLKFALLLAFLVGLSTLIPVVGAVVVTLPVAIVAYFQFHLAPEFAYVIIAFGIIQALDGYLLVPLLFAEVVNLHPVAIMSAILFFGGVWGFWGVFFAIPLATVVQAVINGVMKGDERAGLLPADNNISAS